MERPVRKQNRLQTIDYSENGAYFITICAKDKQKLFGEIVGGGALDAPIIRLSAVGKVVEKYIRSTNNIPEITVDKYVIMPNHIHLLLQINTDANGRSMIAPTISTVVRLMKGAVSKQAGFSVWQKGFYDHVIRSEQDYLDIWNYIEGNPSKWTEDKLYISDSR